MGPTERQTRASFTGRVASHVIGLRTCSCNVCLYICHFLINGIQPDVTLWILSARNRLNFTGKVTDDFSSQHPDLRPANISNVCCCCLLQCCACSFFFKAQSDKLFCWVLVWFYCRCMSRALFQNELPTYLDSIWKSHTYMNPSKIPNVGQILSFFL